MLHFLFKSVSRESGRFNLTYNILETMYADDNVLFVDFQKADLRFNGDSTVEQVWYFVKNASKSKKFNKIILTDTWESLSYDRFYHITKNLIDEGLYEPEQIKLFFFLYPNSKMLNVFRDMGVEIWHVNYFFPRIYYFNKEYPMPAPDRKLLSFNNMDTVGRRYIISQLFEHGITEGISWGNANRNRFLEGRFFKKNLGRYERDLAECCTDKEINLINKYESWFDQKHSVDNFDNESDDRYTLSNTLYEAPLNLVTETRSQPFFEDYAIPRDVYTQDYYHISEKTTKVLLTNQIFLLFTSVGVLEYLHNFGFKTFGDYIDESYDREEIWTLRAKKIVGELDRILNLPEENWQKLWRDVQPILSHNRTWMRQFVESGKYIVKL